MVFCSTTNSWSKFDFNYPYESCLSMGFNGHVFCNNSLHLLKRLDDSMCHVLVLDLTAQVWREILLPEILKKYSCGGHKTRLLEFEGSLCLIHRLEARLDIWVMKDYVTSNWVLIDRVSLRPIISSEDSPKEVLPFDVIIQILARLPVESIFRFRCVCRSWRRLPLKKHFILLYSAVWSNKHTTLLHIVDFRRNTDVLLDVDEFDGYSRRSFDFFQF
ncbi:F-box protein [Platanthera zijinensis]|uniref:F-box protein n=1 Tax=Platanthera zijinensis TaxID=2320716 RepID=A0AAP0AW84_9ASPA